MLFLSPYFSQNSILLLISVFESKPNKLDCTMKGVKSQFGYCFDMFVPFSFMYTPNFLSIADLFSFHDKKPCKVCFHKIDTLQVDEKRMTGAWTNYPGIDDILLGRLHKALLKEGHRI